MPCPRTYMDRAFRDRCWWRLVGAALLGLMAASALPAATVAWDGGGGDTKWSTALNWVGDVAPGTSDVATFNATSTKSCQIDVAVSVLGLDIQAGYTGGLGSTITQNTTIT